MRSDRDQRQDGNNVLSQGQHRTWEAVTLCAQDMSLPIFFFLKQHLLLLRYCCTANKNEQKLCYYYHLDDSSG